MEDWTTHELHEITAHLSIMFPNQTFPCGGSQDWETEACYFQETQRKAEMLRDELRILFDPGQQCRSLARREGKETYLDPPLSQFPSQCTAQRLSLCDTWHRTGDYPTSSPCLHSTHTTLGDQHKQCHGNTGCCFHGKNVLT